MIEVLRHGPFRRMFAAQIAALLGNGLLTVALALLAYELAGGEAALVLGTVFTIKMLIYVLLSPVAGAFTRRLPRRGVLVTLDLIRAGVVLAMPFATAVWQVYALVAVLHVAAAAFTPTFQATIPDILTDEEEYTRGLSLSRLAYDLESLLSPTIAALILIILPSGALFFGTLAGFVVSAAILMRTKIPQPGEDTHRPFRDQLTRGVWIYLATPRLRGLLSLNLAAAAAGAMVLVNSIVLVRSMLGLGETALALTMGAFGLGSMAAALVLPRALARLSDRFVMLGGAVLAAGALAALLLWLEFATITWPVLLAAWLITGIGYSAILTPSGRLLRRSAAPVDRPDVFTAQFSLSHACWLVTYPLSGWLMTAYGATAALGVLLMLTLLGLGLAHVLWPPGDPETLGHTHPELPPDHAHLERHGSGDSHAHPFHIDDLHHTWPTVR